VVFAIDEAPLQSLLDCNCLPEILSWVDGGSGTGSVKKDAMPVKKHLRGVSAKEQRQYEHVKESAQRSGRYGRRAKEVAARTVLKQHAERGHEKGR